MKRMGINAQIALSMVLAALFVTFVVGEFERRAETKRMNEELLAQAKLTVSLLSWADARTHNNRRHAGS